MISNELELSALPLRVEVRSADPLVRAALTMLLERAGIVVELDADVVLADGDCASLSSDVASTPSTPVVALVLTGAAADEAIEGGARGAIARNSDASTMIAALTAAARGLTVLDPTLSSPRPQSTRDRSRTFDELTPRETEVLQHLAGGLTNKEIAARLHISDHTVKFHVNAILGKLGAQTRTEAVMLGVRLGWVIL